MLSAGTTSAQRAAAWKPKVYNVIGERENAEAELPEGTVTGMGMASEVTLGGALGTDWVLVHDRKPQSRSAGISLGREISLCCYPERTFCVLAAPSPEFRAAAALEPHGTRTAVPSALI